MNYYINEYSLRGQFSDVDSFYCSLRDYTLPALKKIESDMDNVIFKKNTLWDSEICKGINFYNIPQKRNERSTENTLFKIKLNKLITKDPFWSENDKCTFEVKEYRFDINYKNFFSKVNCFVKAIENEGRIISFLHDSYRTDKLSILITRESKVFECELVNIYSDKWWNKDPEIKTWRIYNRYIIEIRANEFDYHPPHFHVKYNEFSAVFKLSDGRLYTSGKNKMPSKVIDEIGQWYEGMKEELKNSWNSLHLNNICT